MRLRAKTETKGNAGSSKRASSERRVFDSSVTVTEMRDFHSVSDVDNNDSQQPDAVETINHVHNNQRRTKDVLLYECVNIFYIIENNSLYYAYVCLRMHACLRVYIFIYNVHKKVCHSIINNMIKCQ